MRWPWSSRAELAEEKAREAEADLRRAHVNYQEAHRLADESRKAHARNGFAELIRAAMGVQGK